MLKRVKRINSHAGHARFLAECAEDASGVIPMQDDIPSPYHYSQYWAVYKHDVLGDVVIRETSHKQYDVFLVDPQH